MTEDNAQLELIRRAEKRIEELSIQVGQIGRELSANQQSVTGLWHELTSVRKRLEAVNSEFRSILESHEEHCIARQKAIKKAMALDSEPPQQAKSVPVEKNAMIKLPRDMKVSKFFIWIVLIFCAVLIGAGVVIGALWTGGPDKAGDTIREIGEEIQGK